MTAEAAKGAVDADAAVVVEEGPGLTTRRLAGMCALEDDDDDDDEEEDDSRAAIMSLFALLQCEAESSAPGANWKVACELRLLLPAFAP